MVKMLDAAESGRIGKADYPAVLQGDTLDLDEDSSALGFKVKIEAGVAESKLGADEIG